MDKMIPFYNTENIPGQKYELIGTVKGSMIQEAESINADAVVNIRYATSTIMQGAAEILVYGTAVKFV